MVRRKRSDKSLCISLLVPDEILEHINRETYVDRDAKMRQHFRLMLVNKQWYRCFNRDPIWKNLFSLFYSPKEEITIDFMKQMIRTKHSYKFHSKCMALILRNPKWGLNNFGVGYHWTCVRMMQMLLDQERVPKEVVEKFTRHMNGIDEKRLLFSKLKHAYKYPLSLLKDPLNLLKGKKSNG